MTSNNKNNLDHRVLRVTQLDTSELDDALLVNLKQSINQDYFKYIQLSFFQKYHTEIFAGIKCLLWYYTYHKRGQTVGQSIFDWYYVEQSRAKKILHMIVYCLDEWLLEKLPDLLKYMLTLWMNGTKKNSPQQNDDHQSIREFERSRRIDRFFNGLKLALKMFTFCNYVGFLLNGRYLNLWERIVRLQPVYRKEQYMRSFDHKLFERELLWQSYFSLFKLADGVFDFKKVQAKLRKKLQTLKKPTQAHVDAATRRLNVDISVCGICESQPPTLVHCAVNFKGDGCKHVYCYMCIKKALSEDNDQYSCRICDRRVTSVEMYLADQNF